MENAMFQFIYLLIFLGCEYVHHQSLRLSFPSYDGFLASQTLLLNYRSLLLFSFLVNIHKWLSSSNVSEPPQRRTQLQFENQNAPFLCSSMCRPGGTEEALSPGSRKRTTVVCRHEAWRCFCLTCGYAHVKPKHRVARCADCAQPELSLWARWAWMRTHRVPERWTAVTATAHSYS